MEDHKTPATEKDPRLWEIAKKRADFKANLITYLIINAFFWFIWYFTGSKTYSGGFPWPVWPALGWGIGIIFLFFGAYVYPEANSAEREYEKLKNKRS
jgi:sterol desaturase/sphingolipid hydroxylase (fatty acid hydroxylase superfamily)